MQIIHGHVFDLENGFVERDLNTKGKFISETSDDGMRKTATLFQVLLMFIFTVPSVKISAMPHRKDCKKLLISNYPRVSPISVPQV